MRYQELNGRIYGTRGEGNSITDVPGVLVGQTTIHNEDHHTGVTVILPSSENLFTHKLTAACHVHNGFGKTLGLMQLEELGTLETPIALTNTLNVGLVHDALVEASVNRCRAEGVKLCSVNPVVGECNDARMNEITRRVITEEHVRQAMNSASRIVEEGAVGAGAGTICYGMKGGIGTASRELCIDGKKYVIGVLVQSNFGAARQLLWQGEELGRWYLEHKKELTANAVSQACDQGSIMSIIATDLPLTDRQLKRMIRRAGAGLARTGSSMGHGSGEVMIGFTTANPILQKEPAIVNISRLHEELLNEAFELTADAEMEAVYNSMLQAPAMKTLSGEYVPSLADILEKYLKDTRGKR